MHSEEVVARGSFSSGEDWEITAAVLPDDVMTILAVTRQGAQIFGGGMGGPPVWDDQVMNLYWGLEDGFLGLVIRVVDPGIRLWVTVRSADPRELFLHPIPRRPDIRVAAFGLTVTGSTPVSVSAEDESGETLATFTVPGAALS